MGGTRAPHRPAHGEGRHRLRRDRRCSSAARARSAVFTEITLQLVPKPPAVATLLALFADVRAGGARRAARSSRRGARAALPGAARRAHARRGARAQASRSTRARGAMLLIEVDGDERALDAAARARRRASARTPARSTCSSRRTRRSATGCGRRAASCRRATAQAREVQALRGRRRAAHAHRRPARRGRRASASDRRPARSPTATPATATSTSTSSGTTPASARRVERAIERCSRDVIALRRHAQRRARHRHLEGARTCRSSRSPELIALQQRSRRVFDPQGLLNPGKIFPAGHGAC